MYLLKKELQDFLVDEIVEDSIISTNPTNYHLYLLKKINYTTERAVSHIAKALNISRKSISYAGAKDKNAITTQHIVIRGRSKEQVENLNLKDIELEFKGFAKNHMNLGDLKGNKFTILLRDLKQGLQEVPKDFIVPNYFDDQRFSSNNVEIGMALLKKDFKQAVNLLKEDKDAGAVFEWLKTHPSDFVGALQKMPKKILLFYVHSVQSKLFNEFLKTRIVGDIKKVSYSQGTLFFPKKILEDDVFLQVKDELVGFDSERDLSDFDLETRNFIIPQLPSLTLEGSQRNSFFKVTNCTIGLFRDGVQEVSFVLGKGSYATIVIKQLF